MAMIIFTFLTNLWLLLSMFCSNSSLFIILGVDAVYILVFIVYMDSISRLTNMSGLDLFSFFSFWLIDLNDVVYMLPFQQVVFVVVLFVMLLFQLIFHRSTPCFKVFLFWHFYSE